MLDTYIIMNRKVGFIIKIFIINVSILLLLVIFWINTSTYKSYFQFHSLVVETTPFNFIEVLIPAKEVSYITNQDEIIIDSKKYHYQVEQISSDIIYQDGINYQKVYLKIIKLDLEYQKKGYHFIVKIPKEQKK